MVTTAPAERGKFAVIAYACTQQSGAAPLTEVRRHAAGEDREDAALVSCSVVSATSYIVSRALDRLAVDQSEASREKFDKPWAGHRCRL